MNASSFYYYSRPNRSRIVTTYDGIKYLALEKPITTDFLSDDNFYTIVELDRLDVLAAKFLGDARFWWVIAEYNNIDYAEDLTVGQILRIPSINNLYAKVLG